LHRAVRSAIGHHQDRRHGHPRLKLTGAATNIGVVFQEALLFNRSIADNLRVGKPDATRRNCVLRLPAPGTGIHRAQRARVRDQCRRARAHAVRRRAAATVDCAALMKDPPILILDEATSALDAVTEARVQRRSR
jgi:ATP-binding cassette subfamily B protein